jgi:sodium-dependent dicarboxylate transporter 2/3/5
MADSRTEAFHLFKQTKSFFQIKVVLFFTIILLSYTGLKFSLNSTYTVAQFYACWLLAIAVIFWITEIIPPFATALFIIGFEVFTLGNPFLLEHPKNANLFINTLSNPIIWLLLGGYFLAAGMQKVRLDKLIFRQTVAISGSKPEFIILGLMSTTMLISMFMSNTAATAMMLATVMPFLKTLDKDAPFIKATLLGLPAAAAFGGMGTILGTPPNAIAMGILKEQNIDLNFLQWMLYAVVPMLLLTGITWFLLIKKFTPKITSVDLAMVTENKQEVYNKADRMLVQITIIITLLFWFTTSYHGLNAASVALIPIVVFTAKGIIGSEEFNKMSWDTLFLVAGGLSLGHAIIETGLLTKWVDAINFDGLNWLWLAFVAGLFTVLFSNIMSNTATATLLMPIAVAIDAAHAEGIAIAIALCASCALFLPISTPPNALVFSTGFLQQKEFRFLGITIGILGPIIIALWLLVLQLLF